jgi:uncharacterized spore protein YtfJ
MGCWHRPDPARITLELRIRLVVEPGPAIIFRRAGLTVASSGGRLGFARAQGRLRVVAAGSKVWVPRRTEDVTMADKDANGAARRAEGKVLDEARSAGEGRFAGVLSGLADRIGAYAGAKAVFGGPIEHEGRTVIPVAQSLWGGGAGGGASGAEEASGGGGGAATRPVGYIEITGHGAQFVPLQRPWQDARLVVAWAFAIWLVSRAINHILRG